MNHNQRKKTANKDENKNFVFQLYITGATPNSSRAITNLKDVFEHLLNKKYELEIIDIYQHPELAQKENIIALPLLIKKHPLPERRLIGDMSDTAKLVRNFSLSNVEK